MRYIKVRNVSGTTDRARNIGGSWLEYYKRKSGKIHHYCAAYGCTNTDLVGGHVVKAESYDKSWYIIPICKHHNSPGKEFWVQEEELVSATDN